MKFLLVLLVFIVLYIEAKEYSRYKKYNRVRKEDSDDYDNSEDSYNQGGYLDREWYQGREWSQNDDYLSRRGRKESGKIKYTKLKLDRKIFYYWDSIYENWTNWTSCDPLTCISTRFRKCKDNSWQEKVRDFKVEVKCPVNHIYERRKCSNVKECQKGKDNDANVTLDSLPVSCGKRPQYIETKVFGGKETIKNSWPWHGGLYIIKKLRKPIYICGATLINPGWAVTAAHCLRTLQGINGVPLGKIIDTRKYDFYDKFQLIFGDHDRSEKERTEKVTRISHFILHPSFRADYTSNSYDVALLKLNTVIKKQENIDFACVPETANYTLNTSAKCVAIGWGYVSSQDPFNIWSLEFNWLFQKYRRRRKQQISSNADLLQEVEIPLVEFEKCKKIYKIFNIRKDIHLCAGSTNKDTCRGDSGGGLFCLDPKTNNWQLYGITNFGSARGCGKSYGVYVRVAALADWIRKTLKLPIV